MGEERWIKNIYLIDIELKKVDARNLDIEDLQEDEIELKRKSAFELVKREGNDLKIKLIDNLYFKPKGPFEILIEYLGGFRVKGNIPDKITEEDIKSIAQPLLMHSVSLIADITEKFGMVPVILPPWSGLDEDEES